MYWSRILRVLISCCVLFAATAYAEKGSFILGAGIQGDSADGTAAMLFGDIAVADQTWITGSLGRNAVELRRGIDLETWYGDLGIDHYFDPAGIRIGVAYWGDSSILDSTDFRGSLYTRSDKGMLALEFDYRDFEFNLPPVDLLPRTTVPFNAAGLGLSGRVNVSERITLQASGVRYEYDITLRNEDAARVIDLLSISRLSLLSSLIDWQVSAGAAFEFGLKQLSIDVSRWRGSIDGGENHALTLRFLTPMTDRTDIEISLGQDRSELYGDVTVASVFIYFYGGN